MVDDALAETPREHLQRVDEEWRAIAERVLGPDASLVAVSRYLCDSRVYAAGGHIAKIRRRNPDSPHEFNRLSTEAELLHVTGRAVTSESNDDWEYVVQDEIVGTTFSAHLFEQQETSYGAADKIRVLRRLIPELRRVHRLGVSHGDLRPENILLNDDGVVLVDFDLARRASPKRAAYRDWIGLGPSGLGSPNPFWKLALFALAPRVRTVGLRVRGALRPPRSQLEAPVSQDLADLDEAWRLAMQSRANAKGQNLAYYAFSYRNHHFTGERAWYSRWDAISSSIDFTGKSLLELGCNMGMLSSFAMLREAGSAHGVDHDPDIVDAAKLVARGLGSGATFEQVDLMGVERWEERLGGRDIATALSVVHWLPEKERVLAFLGTHQELIYEGHDTLDIETARLSSIGFDHVDVVMVTERDRHILHAWKSS